MSITGQPLPLRAPELPPEPGRVPRRTAGPLAHMRRLREIELSSAHEAEESPLEAWHALAHECLWGRGGERSRAHGGDAAVRVMSFDEVNDLIERHNRWYPVESRLPMDPQMGRPRPRQRPRVPAPAARRRLAARALPASARARCRSPCPHERVDRGAVRAVDVTEHALGLLHLEPGRSATRSSGV